MKRHHRITKNKKLFFESGETHIADSRSEQLRSRELNPKASRLATLLVVLALLTTAGAYLWSRQQRTDAATVAFEKELTQVSDLINDRTQAYEDALYGFRGLFHSSDSVNEKEFTDYFQSIELQDNYPGLNNLTYVTNVPKGEQASFIQKVKNDTSLDPKGHPSFSIIANGGYASAFVVTYRGLNQATSAGGGVDLASNDLRRPVLEQARDTGKPASTPTIKLLDSQGKETGDTGFLMTIPVYESGVPSSVEARRTEHQGFVNAVFSYDKLLGDVLGDKLPKDVSLTLYDDANNAVYKQGNVTSSSRKKSQTLTIADRTWKLEVEAPSYFGVSTAERRLPALIIIGGVALTALLAYVFRVQGRSRQKAIELARDMTQDLRDERNSALATKNKDEAILSSIGDGVFALDMKGNVILFNKAAEVLTDYTASDAMGKHYEEVLSFKDHHGKKRDDFIHQALAGQPSTMKRHTLLHQKSGKILSVADSAAPIFDASGKQQGIIVVFRDVTTQEEFERKLQASNERFELVAKATQDLIYDIDLSTGAMAWNDALYDTYGYKHSEQISSLEWWTHHIHPDDAVKVSLTIDHIFSGKMKVIENEYRFQKADGNYRYIRDRAFVVRDSKGEPLRLIGSMLDVTKQKEFDRAKDEFISLVSHQLRTPLTAIRLFTEMLVHGQVGKLSDGQQSYLEKIDLSTKRMIQLVSDILNVSRMELGRIKIDPVPTDVNKLIQSHLDEVEPLASAKQVKIVFKADSKIPEISMDPTMFGQFVHNLLTNAIRYAKPEDAKVSVGFHAEQNGYVLSVSDNGIGIPPESQERIFERFFRAENAVKAEGEGTGLGLYLLKIIAESVGGKIWFESQLGKGTTFYVRIPLGGMKAKTGEKTLG